VSVPVAGSPGLLVVTLAEGRILGAVQAVYLNPAKRRLSGILLRERGLGAQESWVDIGDIPTLGEHVLFVKGARDCKAKSPVGRSLKDFLGMQVATTDGKILGSLVDFAVDPKWRIVGVRLSDERALEVDPKHAVFGQDAILLKASAVKPAPASAAARPGLLARVFGAAPMREAADAITRAEKSGKVPVPAAKEPSSDPELPKVEG
jgi:sporulation protein YlmC with PRC-barrel domain